MICPSGRRDEHVLVVVVASTGAVVAQRSVPATARGYARALSFADEHAAGRRVWAVEGRVITVTGLLVI